MDVEEGGGPQSISVLVLNAITLEIPVQVEITLPPNTQGRNVPIQLHAHVITDMQAES